MKYFVEFSCGHEERVELVGKYADRERKMKWFHEEGLCSECYRKQKEQEMLDNGYEIVEMFYGEYKEKYSENKTVRDSYDKKTKTIKVWVKRG